MEVSAEFLQGVVSYVEKTEALIEKAASVEYEVASRAPAVVDTLIKAGMLDAENRSVAIENVRDPLKVQESLRKVAALMAKNAAASKTDTMGSGSSGHSKSAGASDTPSKGGMRESDRIFLERFGLA